jgi:hypothetical protein
VAADVSRIDGRRSPAVWGRGRADPRFPVPTKEGRVT